MGDLMFLAARVGLMTCLMFSISSLENMANSLHLLMERNSGRIVFWGGIRHLAFPGYFPAFHMMHAGIDSGKWMDGFVSLSRAEKKSSLCRVFC